MSAQAKRALLNWDHVLILSQVRIPYPRCWVAGLTYIADLDRVFTSATLLDVVITYTTALVGIRRTKCTRL